MIENRTRQSRARVHEAKEAYATAINRRSASQREVNELLQRKHTWTSADLERFTSLYRNDHTNEMAEADAQESLTRAEQEAEDAAAQLSKCILSRYHEEQVWSDKIRRMSTWGTWGLMGMNVLLFLVFQIAVEPWRRRRLVTGFEEKVIEALEKDKEVHPSSPPVHDGQDESSIHVVDREPPAVYTNAPVVQPKVPTTTSSSSGSNRIFNILQSCKTELSRVRHPLVLDTSLEYLQDCFSHDTIVTSNYDVTNTAVQGAAVGAALTYLVMAILRSQ